MHNEENRLAASCNYQPTEQEPQENFDQLINMAAAICETKISLISICHQHTHSIKACKGASASYTIPEFLFEETRNTKEHLLVLDDVLLMPFYSPAVRWLTENKCRFFARLKLADKKGNLIGCILLFDENPKKISEHQKHLLINLGQMAVSQVYANTAGRIDAEKRLQISEEKHRSYFENLEGLMCTFDLQGNFLSFNPKGAKMLGYTEEELVKSSVQTIVDPTFHSRIQASLKEFKTNTHRDGLIKLRNKSGVPSTWLYNMQYCELLNGESYVICSALDITDRIELEKSLVEAKEAALKSVHSKDVFLANMSHEIRTPMNAIIGFSTLLEQTLLNAEQAEFNGYIKSAAENLLGIINDILDFSKIESGRIEIESTPFEPEKIFGNVVHMLSHAARLKGLVLKCVFQEQLPNFVIGDPTRLTQVLINLVNNAIKFTERGSVILEIDALAETAENLTLKVLVKDTGIGIAPDKVQSIFDRFTQADAKTTRKYGGTGLGLSIVKSLLKLQGGNVWVQSTPGEGSVFGFYISYKKMLAAYSIPEKSISTHVINTSDINVLLVEDNLVNLKLATKVLEKFNYIVYTATNGSEAVQLVQRKNFDVILMDLEMPVMDGYQATEIIRNELKINTPIFAMTAHSLVGEQEKCLSIGMNGYISKPFQQSVLLNTITQAVKENAVLIENEYAEEGNTEFDLSYLHTISEGNTQFEKEIFDLFISQTPADFQDLKNAINQTNYTQVRHTAHKITASFRLLGINSYGVLDRLQYKTTEETPLKRLKADYRRLYGIYMNIADKICREQLHLAEYQVTAA